MNDLRIAKDHIVNCYCGMTWDELLQAEARGDISEKGRSLIASVRLLERAGASNGQAEPSMTEPDQKDTGS